MSDRRKGDIRRKTNRIKAKYGLIDLTLITNRLFFFCPPESHHLSKTETRTNMTGETVTRIHVDLLSGINPQRTY
jgi:hypothetical protein